MWVVTSCTAAHDCKLQALVLLSKLPFCSVHDALDVIQSSCSVGALKAYKRSLELHRQLALDGAPQENGDAPDSQAAAVPARLLNNAAVVHMACGKQREALDLLIEASQVPSHFHATADRMRLARCWCHAV